MSAGRLGRKADLRRLAAKHGWYDGHEGAEPKPPTKIVMSSRGGVAYSAVPVDEEAAYWQGFYEGKDARTAGLKVNPYGRYS